MTEKLPRITAGKILHPKVLKSILRDADLTIEAFKELIKK